MFQVYDLNFKLERYQLFLVNNLQEQKTQLELSLKEDKLVNYGKEYQTNFLKSCETHKEDLEYYRKIIKLQSH